MLSGLTDWFFDDSALTAHGFCLLWEPGLIWTYALSDAAIAIAYFSIPVVLVLVARKRSDLIIRPMLWLFAAFILLCGTTHWLDIVTLWLPWYGIEAVVKAATALVSISVAISLWWYLPWFLKLPSHAQMQAANAALLASREQLAQVQKMEAVGQLTGGIAHDFNNMLQVISGALELIDRRIARERFEDVPRYLSAIRQATERAAKLTSRLLAFSRRQALQPRTIDPQGLVEGLSSLLQRTLGQDTTVNVEAPVEPVRILCDPHQLESALVNLTLNARDAMPNGGKLTLAVRERHFTADELVDRDVNAGAFVEISVHDTGGGMTPDVLRRAVEPFFTTRTVGTAAGLGLSQVYGFMRQSGGFLRLDSAPGAGTTVHLYFPKATGAEASDPQTTPRLFTPPNPGAGLSRRILLVDDEQEVRNQIALALRESGFVVEEAHDGTAGLRILQAGQRFDLIVTDVGMPGMNGRQLADAARAIAPEMPILLITGYAGKETEHLQHMADIEIMRKPFSLTHLVDRVSGMLAS